MKINHIKNGIRKIPLHRKNQGKFSLTFSLFLPYKDYKTQKDHKKLMFIIGRFFSLTNQDTLLLQ